MENESRDLLAKTEKSKVRFDELTDLVSRPEIIADNREWKKLVKERNSLEGIAEAHVELAKLVEDMDSCQKDFEKEKDAEMKQLFESEIENLKEKINNKIDDIKILLLPKDENDDSNAIVEIRSAAECILIMLKRNAGKSNILICQRRKLAESKKQQS